VVNYGLLPGTPLLLIVEQVRRACAWLHHNARALDIDPGRIVCSGHSAGGHLTAMMLATDWPGVWPEFPARLLSGAVTLSGLFDLEPLTRAEFIRNDLRLEPALARALSPAYLPWRNEVSMIRAVGAEESGEFHRQSTLMGAHWPLACERELIDVPGCNHLSVCDAFADSRSELFQATRDLLSGC
jgi:arylformamidase